MANPVSSSPRNQAQPAVTAQQESQTAAIDNKEAQQSQQASAKAYLAAEFERVLAEYYVLVSMMDGCGKRGQNRINLAHEELSALAAKHPEFLPQVPAKYISTDDGKAGFSTGPKRLRGMHQKC